ncbi:zinc finger CCCH domain-containing protein 3 isoform X2 [Harpegnathos saltator]|uniref:zinc finger CCCH domain-containing protein 3 isoform X2 n=1 Tax=Harpegnathos saltator TaxID=610380 RepID=UPI00058CA3DC|nr:zinc finger CCCH domain-containing protein 3 isoform X2 [Harpegnathos saltator]
MNSPNRSYKYVKPKADGNLVPGSFLNSKIFPKMSIESTHVEPQSFTANVYINPNFKLQKPTMHINPKIRAKPSIHVNPKMVHDIASSNQNLQSSTLGTIKASIGSNIMQANIKRSIYVNPTLLKGLSSSSDYNSNEVHRREQPVCSKMPLKNMSDQKVTPKKLASDSDVVLLSRRKLVRVTGTANNLLGTSTLPLSQCKLRESTNLTEKRSGTIVQKVVKVPSVMSNMLQCTNLRHTNVPKLNINKSKVTKYKIDRTVLNTPKIKGSQNSLKRRKITNNTVGLVTIGGIVYKSSKNRLIRRSYLLKRKRSTNGNDDKLISTKKLRPNKEIPTHYTLDTNTLGVKTRRASNISSKTIYKNTISNKVKQRSLQILRNKMRKNNQPCLIFQRFGYCQNYKNGTCPKQHDKKQVSICKKFLQGKCLLDKCPLSHDVGPEKMPTCKYFLDGCCTRDACPYLHVKVSSNTSICIDFLQGYCVKGNECQRRHEYLCPEFDKRGICSKGEYCVYPHKSHTSNVEENIKYLSKKMHDVKKYQATPVAKVDTETSNLECRLRYYETTDNSIDSLEKKKENILRKLQIMKTTLNNVPTADSTNQMQSNETNESLIKEDESKSMTSIASNASKRRAPIGLLPAYIPIN